MNDNSSRQAQVHATVSGRVQGVNFRYHATRTARRLGLSGWVANRRDGTVEVVAEGVRSDLDEFVSFLHRGSPAASVDEVDLKWKDPSGEFDGFRVRYL